MTSKLETLLGAKARRRREDAVRHALSALRALRNAGVEAGVVGSLARGTFGLHSDVDFLILGHPGKSIDEVLAIIEQSMVGLAFDVIFRETVPADELSNLMEELADASDLCQIAASSWPSKRGAGPH